MSTKIYRFVLRYVIPEIKFLHGLGPSYATKQKIRDIMQEGDILLSKRKFYLTNILIGGDYSHAALVVGKDKIAEMSANDFDVVDVDHFCKGCSGLVLLRLKDLSDAYGKKMAQKCMSFALASYDLKFTLGVEALYCSELVYQSDFERRIKCDLSDLVGMGCAYISPDGLAQARGVQSILTWQDNRLNA